MDPKRLRSLRERAGLTQHQLARAVGVVGGERVSRWESGRSTPRPGALGRIAEILDVSVETLFIAPAGSATLWEQRLSAGLTIAQLAEAVYVSSRTVVRWENGDFESDVFTRRVSLLAERLGVSAPRVEQALRGTRGQDS
ncbi:helix-turn-helix transcriptional regulator [uncultured Serinicoccus sp.]|uniref:helix-turn-helix transcriptional regulator n=1 Tax=uncultured Serinicoccus sp. TaxID=735514 RepID=UPI0026208149|nr:helix-turn-helix transcriptional regulator [uncultured Serinicoccus sp.]